jgi:hypothetical protein
MDKLNSFYLNKTIIDYICLYIYIYNLVFIIIKPIFISLYQINPFEIIAFCISFIINTVQSK